MVTLSGTLYASIHDKAKNVCFGVTELLQAAIQHKTGAMIFSDDHHQSIRIFGCIHRIHNGVHRGQVHQNIIIHIGNNFNQLLKSAGIQQFRGIIRSASAGNQIKIGIIGMAFVSNDAGFQVLFTG